ncbi:hypothetical protein QBC41DRAFT_340681 [Cercophora samala]|uniref:Uncharacterized protein n=1 Tax=Cercophora samala TaxID=330535 RepID=A0AA40D6Y9_9PEZI|nr:hypothetical protein QBC41DRAFT_340681 [Cercophora samala]
MGNNVCAVRGQDGYSCDFLIAGSNIIGNLSANTLAFGNVSALEEKQNVAADPDIAGPGIVFAVKMAFGVSIGIALLIHFLDLVEICTGRDRSVPIRRIHHILNRILVSWSDQQIVLGLAISTAALDQWCSFSTYHLNIIKHWLIISSITHVNALLVHCNYFQKKKMAATGLRGLLISLHVIFTGVVVFSNGQSADNKIPEIHHQTPLQILPASCFFTNSTRSNNIDQMHLATPQTETGYLSSKSLFIWGIVLIVSSILTLPRHLWDIEDGTKRHLVVWGVRLVQLALNLTLGVLAIGGVENIRSWMSKQGLIDVSDGSESDYSYGQYLSAFLALFAAFQIAESFLDDIDE